MEREEDTVRVWGGLNFLQAEMMKQMLLENGIACFGDRDPGVLPFGEFGESGLWVSKQDGTRARQVLEIRREHARTLFPYTTLCRSRPASPASAAAARACCLSASSARSGCGSASRTGRERASCSRKWKTR